MKQLLALLLCITLHIGCSTVKTADVNVSLTWTNVADNGLDPLSGNVAQVDLRYSIDSLELINDWTNAAQFPGQISPLPPLMEQTHSGVIYLQTGVNYYFAIKSADEVPNWSDISNIAVVFIPDTFKPGRINDLQVTL